MQAYKAYYDNGRFIPVGAGKLPDGAQAIIAVLDEPPLSKEARLAAFDRLAGMIDAAAEEEMPAIERIKL